MGMWAGLLGVPSKLHQSIILWNHKHLKIMFKYILGISLDTGKGQNDLRHYSKMPYIIDTARLRKQVLTQNTYLLIIYEQVDDVYSDTTEIPPSDTIIF